MRNCAIIIMNTDIYMSLKSLKQENISQCSEYIWQYEDFWLNFSLLLGLTFFCYVNDSIV